MREVYIPDASGVINAFSAGQRMRQQREADAEEQRSREARRGVGAAMATGDYAGAAKLAYDTGDLNTGLQLQQRGDAATAAARKRELIKQSKTDPKAAADAALDAGEFDLYEDLKGLTDAAEKQRYGQFAAVIRSIGQEEPDQWDDLVAANRGQLESLGIPAQEIDGFIRATPEQRTGMMAMLLQRADQFDKFQTERHQDRTHAATEADRAADNKRAEAQLALSRQSVGISAGNLGQRRAEHAARLAGKGGYAAGAGNPNTMTDAELLAALNGGR